MIRMIRSRSNEGGGRDERRESRLVVRREGGSGRRVRWRENVRGGGMDGERDEGRVTWRCPQTDVKGRKRELRGWIVVALVRVENAEGIIVVVVSDQGSEKARGSGRAQCRGL
eukprot:1182853-Rhodomonas_salina.1